jgi:DNA processing protein
MFGMDPTALNGPRPTHAGDKAFPARFSDLPVPPRVLWVDGRVPRDGETLLAIVGSRSATVAASARVRGLAADLARAGFGVISGGALGIDAAAHRGAMEGGGVTFAVLGCGIDVVYPDRHAGLFRQIVSGGGGLMSEYAPGVPPRPGQFPVRNRLVAALARAVIVGESRNASGALITARQARALGRQLLAIPGSAGSDGLLAAGAATPVQTAGDVLDALAGKPGSQSVAPAAFSELLAALGPGPTTADAIARRLGIPLPDALAVLFDAELDGFVVRASGGRFEVSRGH